MEGTCSHCKKEKATSRCARCGVFYCNRDCQKADWSTHKLGCATKPKTETETKGRYVDEVVEAGWFNPVMLEPGSPSVVMTQQRGCKKIMLDFSDLESAVGSMVKGDLKIMNPVVEKVCSVQRVVACFADHLKTRKQVEKAEFFSTIKTKTKSKDKKALYTLFSGEEFAPYVLTCMEYVIVYSEDEASHEKHRETVISHLKQADIGSPLEILDDYCSYSLSDIKFL